LSRLFKAAVIDNKEVALDHFLLTLHPTEKIKKPRPGTFFMVSVSSGLDPLLKRPISIHRWLGNDFQLLYRVVGKGTSLLSTKRAGEEIEVLGPLGNGFPARKKENRTILVAGGLGIAPVFALAEKLYRPAPAENPLFFYGARTKKEVLCLDELKSIGIDPIISTDDGTYGKKGNILTVLKRYISRQALSADHYEIFACGPEPMLEALSKFAVNKNIPGHISLEQNMACGVGTCIGCVVNTKKGYKRVCKEGPVFKTGEIAWQETPQPSNPCNSKK